jgi:HK97 family phage major capsid protein
MPEDTKHEMTREELVKLIHEESAKQGKPAPQGDDLAIVRDATAEAVAAALKPLLDSSNSTLNAVKDLAEVQKEREAKPKLGLGRKVRLYALGTMDENGKALGGRSRANDMDYLKFQARRNWGELGAEAIKFVDYQQKASVHTVHDSSVAGDIVQPAYSPEWIELLRPATTVRRIAATDPMPRGALSVRKQTQDATAYYQGESDKMTQSNIEVGRETMSYKKLTALCVLNNDLIRFGGPEADARVEASMVAAAGQREDQAFLMGNPPTNAGSPKGIVFWANSGSRFQNAGSALTNFQSDIGIALGYLWDNDIPVDPTNTYIIMNPITWLKILSLSIVTGDLSWAATTAGGRLTFMGYPALVTSQLSKGKTHPQAAFVTALSQTYGGSIIVAYAPALRIYDSYALTTTVYPGGAYYDAALSAVASGISNDETVVTAIAEHDFFMSHDRAASVIMNYNL